MKNNIYETDNLALCPYLIMNNLKYLETRFDKGSKKYVFIFEDKKKQGTDLAMAFLRSAEREYKNLWGFFRNELVRAQDKTKDEDLIK